MKKILINIHYLELGGAETALIGLLHSLDPSKVKVDLMINDKRGELLKFIPDWVNVLDIPSDYAFIESPIKECLKKGYLRLALARLLAKYKFHRYKKKFNPKDDSAIFGFVGKYTTPVLPSLNNLGQYDLAISWLTPHNIILNKISAKQKVCWIHTDYSAIDVNKELELPVWNGYDKIISISGKVSDAFCSVFPELKPKLIEIENLLPVDLIRERAKEFTPKEMPTDDDTIKFLTIGRYCHAKNLEAIPSICKSLRDKGLNAKWFIIGYGGSDQYIRDVIQETGMQDYVKILGKKENPYPYIKACDCYVQPSRYEGKSITVREAQILGKPVVITPYPTASSQIIHEKDGFITPDMENFADYIADLWLNHQDKIEVLKQNLANTDFCSSPSLLKFYSLP